MRIEQLKINRSTETMGIPTEDLRFSFVADLDAVYHCSVVTVTGRTVAERKVSLPDAVSFSFEPLQLHPATRYEFRVCCGESMATLPFETAVFFDAPMITPATPLVAPVLIRSFSLPEGSGPWRLAITGLGLYRAEINGQRVGDTYLTPGFNDYHGYLRFDTYDVSDLIRPEK